MITFSAEDLRERIFACWIGKNIGGTLGTPYEGTRELLNISGFASKAGEPLPNDDLDLQLVWLRAVDEMGPQNINSKVLGEYWLSYINPNWNEYGVCKANMRSGLIPPLSGEVFNDEWKHSNGAWIRTEIWACLYPAMPEKAIRMAFEDASVDHGFGEGTYAAIFIAAMESAAFAVRDARELLKIGLSKIPESCRVARSVNLVIDCYDQGMPWADCRNAVVRDSADLGWFQAPANVAFVVLGLLYGEGDFKQSLIYAVNCGDDTDCTGATLGALLGIMGGSSVIPNDWRAYIGDSLKVACLTYGHGSFPQDCHVLTDHVMNLLPVTLHVPLASLEGGRNYPVKLSDRTDLSACSPQQFYGRDFVNQLKERSAYSYTVEGLYANVIVNFDTAPRIEPNGTLSGKLILQLHTLPEPKLFHVHAYLPDGWTADYEKTVFVRTWQRSPSTTETAFTIHAGDKAESMNTVILELLCPGRPDSLLVPLRIMA